MVSTSFGPHKRMLACPHTAGLGRRRSLLEVLLLGLLDEILFPLVLAVDGVQLVLGRDLGLVVDAVEDAEA